MTAATVSRFGQQNGAGGSEVLFLKVASGEVLTAFHDETVTLDKHMIRSIASGKSAQFPAAAKITAGYHTPGAEIVGTVVNHNERVISIDDLLIAHAFVAQIDDAMNHYDVRSIYTTEIGEALAEQFDKHVLQQAYLAAAASATVSGGDAGQQVTDADADSNGSSLAGAMFDIAQNFDEKAVPKNQRFLFLAPAQYYLLVQTTDVINRDWGGEGAYAAGDVFRVGGINIIETNHLPNGSNINSAPGHGDGDTRHAVNATNFVGVSMHPSAVGTVRLIGMSVEVAWDFRRQGWLLIGKQANGHGILRPESASLIKTA